MSSLINLDPKNLLAMFLFSGIGYIYFSFGRRQARPKVMLCGIALMGYSYFTSTVGWTVGVGVLFSVAPFVLRWW